MTTPRHADAGTRAQEAAEAHLAACWQAEEGEPDEDTGQVPDSPAIAAFCGCQTCEVREVLAAAWPVLLEDAAETVADAGHLEASQLLRDQAARMHLVPADADSRPSLEPLPDVAPVVDLDALTAATRRAVVLPLLGDEDGRR